jgi:hypothetical protein
VVNDQDWYASASPSLPYTVVPHVVFHQDSPSPYVRPPAMPAVFISASR